MSVIPESLVRRIEAIEKCRVVAATPASGGMINQAAMVDMGRHQVFIKWHPAPPPRMFAAEAYALELLGAAGALRTPRVLQIEDAPSDDGSPAFLMLEAIEVRSPQQERVFGQRFGEGLAALHAASPPQDLGYGLDRDNYIGILPQHNVWHHRWPQFYVEERLTPQIEIAKRRLRLPSYRQRLLDAVLPLVEDVLAPAGDRVSLVHGDLWSGNLLSAGDEPVVIDPAAYCGHPEVELAFIELFGGFPAGWFDAYRSSMPVAEGYAERRPLLQLYPLLVHLNIFGETYGPAVDDVCRRSARNQ